MNKKCKYAPNKNFAPVADRLRPDEARKVNAFNSNMRKKLQMKYWLEDQKAKLDSLIWGTQESLRDTFEATKRLDSRMNAHKLQIKRNVSQVFSMAA